MTQTNGINGNSFLPKFELPQINKLNIEGADISEIFEHNINISSLNDDETTEIINGVIKDIDKDSLINILINLIKKLYQSESPVERETNKTVKDYEKMFPIVSNGIVCTVERPTTSEFQEHDKQMNKVRADYIKNHPEPQENNSLMSIMGNSEHLKWEKELNEYMDACEKVYRESHPEYSKQAQAYENKLKQAGLMC